MERLTVKRDKKNVFQSIYYAECEQYKGGCVLISCPFDCSCEIEQELFNRLGKIEDILGDDYDLDRLKVIVNQQMTMREEVSQRFSLTAKIPLDRLKELVEADRDGRCFITLPFGEEEGPSANDPVGPEGDPGVPVKIVCEDESGDVTPEKWDWLMNRFLRGEKSGQNL